MNNNSDWLSKRRLAMMTGWACPILLRQEETVYNQLPIAVLKNLQVCCHILYAQAIQKRRKKIKS